VKQITEHSSTIEATLPKRDVHSKMDVFYNPVMVSNRNISILLLNSIPNKNMKLCLPLAGSGIRGLRFIKELKKGKMKQLYVNDKKETFIETFERNLSLNKIKNHDIILNTNDATKFLLNQDGFDYIDIDPFGTPNPFIGAAMARISRDGILAVTATDTAALTGTYQKVTKRKYWGSSIKNWMMHETGLRILIRKIQLQGVQFDKALVPVLAYHKDHYFRIYFRVMKGKERCDAVLKKHQYLLFNSKTLDFKNSTFNKEEGFNQFAGPLWTGRLWDATLVKRMASTNVLPEEQKFLDILNQEKDTVGFFDIHALAKKHKFKPSRMDGLLDELDGSRTHFSLNGIKTDKKLKDVISLLKKN
jgi:tRNA (guanine26-N2/guanine27-N2)-dimethyltransferase